MVCGPLVLNCFQVSRTAWLEVITDKKPCFFVAVVCVCVLVVVFQLLLPKSIQVEFSALHTWLRQVAPIGHFPLILYPSLVGGALCALFLSCVYLQTLAGVRNNSGNTSSLVFGLFSRKPSWSFQKDRDPLVKLPILTAVGFITPSCPTALKGLKLFFLLKVSAI